MTIKAIETRYKGYRFRSRLEARWAVFFDALGLDWRYEEEGFDLEEYGWYLPDFWLPKFDMWVEIKGKYPTNNEIDLAEKLAQESEERVVILIGLPSHCEDDGYWLSPNGSHVCDGAGEVEIDACNIPPFRSDNFNHRALRNSPAPEEWGYMLTCPICNQDYVHFDEPVFEDSDDYGTWQGRGSALRVPMWCESGHSWLMRMGFHKGNSFVAIENVRTSITGIATYFAGEMIAADKALEAARSARFEHGENGAS